MTILRPAHRTPPLDPTRRLVAAAILGAALAGIGVGWLVARHGGSVVAALLAVAAVAVLAAVGWMIGDAVSRGGPR